MLLKTCVFISFVLILTAKNLNAQQKDIPRLTGPYLGQKPPGMTPEVFAPGVVSREGIQTPPTMTGADLPLHTERSSDRVPFARVGDSMQTSRIEGENQAYRISAKVLGVLKANALERPERRTTGEKDGRVS